MKEPGDRWYRRLLALFPADFRADFGESMAADFRDEARDARRRGRGAVAALWIRTIRGFLHVGPREHLSRLTLDARHGLRLAWRRPGPTMASAFVLALGIAALTATFTIVDAFMLRRLPFAEPQRLMHVWTRERLSGEADLRSSWPDIQAWAGSTSLRGIAAFNYTEEDLVEHGRPERIDASRVSANVLEVLGSEPAHGRAFLPGEDIRGAAPVALVSDGFARRRFGGAREALGRSITVGAVTHHIVGVMRADFVFPLPVTQVWLPYEFDASFTRARQSLQAVARLAPGVSREAAVAELTAVARAQSEVHGDREPRAAALEPLRAALNFADDVFRIAGPVLVFASVLILLVACANVSSVLLGQALARTREAAVRAAIGASRLRLVRQFAFEQTGLLAAAVSIGLVLAHATLGAIAAIVPPDLYRVGHLALDYRSAACAVAAAAAAVLAASVIPAVRVGRADVSPLLRRGGTSQSATPRALRLQHALIATQVCASVALVAVTFTALAAVERLTSHQTGFDPQHALTSKFILPTWRYSSPESVASFHQRLTERLRAVPRISAAATVNHLPLNHETARVPVGPPSDAQGASTRPSAIELRVSSGYLPAMGVPLLAGRDFTDADGPGNQPVAMINRTLAEKLWPGQPAVDRMLDVGQPKTTVRIVGVAATARQQDLVGPDEPVLYRPMSQVPARYARLVVRTEGDPQLAIADVHAAVSSVDPALPLTEVRTLEEVIREFLLPQRATSIAIAVLGTVALAIAGTGLYGLLVLLVAGRYQEIGIRLALGAGSGGIVRSVAGRTLVTAATGMAAGLAVSALLARALASLLPGASALDGRAMLLTPVLLAVVTFAAGIVPLRRATRVDPVSVIRGT